MVGVTAAVLRTAVRMSSGIEIQIADQILEPILFQVGLAFDRIVKIRDVSLMMLV